MLDRVITKFEDPRGWLFAGAVCFALSFGMAYHQAQTAADQFIALHTAPARIVTIQDFGAVARQRSTAEVHILAETDIAAPVAVDYVTDEGLSRSALIYPLYPVSRAGRDAILRAKGAPPRPVARPSRQNLDRPEALGIAVHSGATRAEATLAAETAFGTGLGGGRFGRVVEVHGAEVKVGNLEYVAQGAVAAFGNALSPSFIAVKPFEKSRMEAVALPPLSPWHGPLRIMAVLCAVAAIYFSLNHHLPIPRRRKMPSSAPALPQSTGHQTFAPIATQDEIAHAEAEDRARAIVEHPVVRILDSCFQEVKGIALSRVRSRRSHRAD